MTEEVSLFAAFLAGLLSFVSPCVLPLIPGYLSFVSGVTLEEMRGTGAAVAPTPAGTKRRAVLMSIAFVLGFSMVFISLGASATALGSLLMEHLALLSKIAGGIIILFGLHMMGVLRIGWLYSEKRVQPKKKPAGFFGAVLVGVAFAFGWTPCIGPILSAILFVAAGQDTVGQGVELLAVYSAGLGVPFIATSLAINQFLAASARIRKHYHTIEVVSGVLMVIVGVLIFTNKFTIIAQYLTPYLPTF
ncbi:MAG TPA: cytochrome c biogenesis protein CcdA [Vicinamibacterales bacterium]|nr:cytochrome c biogenesis protein CcdA [Vicinamibacterales bacterium]